MYFRLLLMDFVLELLEYLPVLSAEDDVVVSYRILEEVVREDSMIPHLQEHLGAAQVASVLVLHESCLLTEHSPEVCRSLEERDISFSHLPVNGDSYSRFKMGVVGILLHHIERHCAVRKQHCSSARGNLRRVCLESAPPRKGVADCHREEGWHVTLAGRRDPLGIEKGESKTAGVPESIQKVEAA